MKLQNILKTGLIAMVALTACNDDFMQQDPKDKMADGTFFVKEADLPLYLDGLYKMYITGHGIEGTNITAHDKGFHGIKAGSQITYSDVFSDNATYAGGIDARLRGTYETPMATEKECNSWTWDKLRSVNYFLNHYKEVNADPKTLDKYAAEAYFFKAWDYYIKLLAVGEVPWFVTDLNIDSEELYAPRTPRVQLVDSIMMCFDFAIEHLEDNTKSYNRINKNMARFLKARFCLFEGTFRKYHTNLGLTDTANEFLREARDMSDLIISNPAYQLYHDPTIKNSYWKLFSLKQTPDADGNKEAILARVYNGTNLGHDNQRYWEMNNHTRYAMGATTAVLEEYLCEDGRPIYIGGSPGNYEVNPLFKGYDGLWEEMDNRDPRLCQTIARPGGDPITGTDNITMYDPATGKRGLDEVGIIYPMLTNSTGGAYPAKLYNSTSTGYRYMKHWIGDVNERDANPKGKQTALMFRLAEAMLIYAEARAELNEITNDDLDRTINKLRERAGFDFAKYPDARLQLNTVPSDPRLDAIYAEKLDYSVSGILREIRRERRVELIIEGFRYEDLIRWKAGKLFTVPLRGVKMTEEKIALYNGRIDEVNPKTGIKETASPEIQLGNDVVLDEQGFIIPCVRQVGIDNGTLPWDDKRYYYPIPLRELQLNPNLTQNPGWKDIAR